MEKRNRSSYSMWGREIHNMVIMSTRRKLIFLALVLVFCGGVLVLQQNLRDGSSLMHNEPGLHNSHDNIEAIPLSYHYNVSDLGELNGPEVKMNNPRLLAAIREKFLRPPPPRSDPYKLKDLELIDTSMGQAEVIRDILHDQKFGFFVEAGALDGETRSNTLVLERYLNWTGLLVEADPSNFAQMMEKKRKAWLSPACLSVHTYPHVVSFKQAFNIGKISEFPAGHTEHGYVDVQCLPLYSLLLAMNRTTVDYFSLDVEGNELEVLRTIPFKDLNIRTISVEYIHVPEGKDVLLQYMLNQGYDLNAEVVHDNNLANDFIFSKKGAVPKG